MLKNNLKKRPFSSIDDITQEFNNINFKKDKSNESACDEEEDDVDENGYDIDYINLVNYTRILELSTSGNKDSLLYKNIDRLYFSKLYYNSDYNDVKEPYLLEDDVGTWYYCTIDHYISLDDMPDSADDNFYNNLHFTNDDLLKNYIKNHISYQKTHVTDNKATRLEKKISNDLTKINKTIIFKKMLARVAKDKEDDLNDPDYIYEEPYEDYTSDECDDSENEL